MKPRHRQSGDTLPVKDVRLAVRLLLPLVVLALLGLIYTNALKNPFVMEATTAIVTNPDVTQPEGLSRLWFHDFSAGRNAVATIYRPVTMLTHHLNARLFGLTPLSFRVVNILLLACLGCLSAMWIGRYTHRTVAWLAGLLLVAHPLNTEAINHIIGRADLLSLIGVVGLLHTQRRVLELKHWSWPRVLVAVFFTVLALGSRETGLMVFPMAAAQLWLSRRGTGTMSLDTPKKVHALAVALILVPLIALVVARVMVVGWSFVAPTDARPDLGENPLLGMSMLQRAPAAISLAWFYGKQVVWPDTSFIHTPDVLPTWESPSTMLGIIVLVMATGWLLVAFRKRNWLALPLLLALGHFAAVCSLLVPAGTYATNRVTPVFILAGVCVAASWFDGWTRGSTRQRAATVIPFALVILVMGWSVVRINTHWSSAEERLTTDLEAHPGNATALYLLGSAQVAGGDASAAISSLEGAVAIRQDSKAARYKLARAYLEVGDIDRAAVQYGKVISQFPKDWQARITLCDAYLRRDDFDHAQEQLAVAEELAPTEIAVIFSRAQLCAARGECDDALRLYDSILTLRPNYAAAHRNRDDVAEQMKLRELQQRQAQTRPATTPGD